MNEFFLIAEVVRAVGETGLLEIKSFSDFPDRFFVLDFIYVDVFGGKKKFFVDKVEPYGDGFLIKLRGFDSSDKTDFLIGKKIFVDENNLVKPEEGTFFIHDLIGSKVYIGGEFFGELTDVLQLPANDVYSVKRPDNSEVLVPALKKIIKNFDAKNKKLVLIDNYFDFLDEN